VPAAGVYAKTPGTLAVASSWLLPSALPNVMAAGADQVMTGVAMVAVADCVAVAALYVPSAPQLAVR
jgi:hypothetical protein